MLGETSRCRHFEADNLRNILYVLYTALVFVPALNFFRTHTT